MSKSACMWKWLKTIRLKIFIMINLEKAENLLWYIRHFSWIQLNVLSNSSSCVLSNPSSSLYGGIISHFYLWSLVLCNSFKWYQIKLWSKNIPGNVKVGNEAIIWNAKILFFPSNVLQKLTKLDLVQNHEQLVDLTFVILLAVRLNLIIACEILPII